MSKGVKCFICFIVIGLSVTGIKGQVRPADIKEFINKEHSFTGLKLQYPEEVSSVYHKINFQPVWIVNADLVKDLSDLLSQSPGYGLKKEQYDFKLIHEIGEQKFHFKNKSDSVSKELTITDAAIHFIHDVLYGSFTPVIGYNGLNYQPDCIDIAEKLSQAVTAKKLGLMLESAGTKSNEFKAIYERLRQYQKMAASEKFTEVKITSSKVNAGNKNLLLKLYQLCYIDSPYRELPDSLVKQKVKLAQQLFNLLPDGILRSTALEAFNVPLTTRIRELIYALNTVRWLECIKQKEKIIVVNIPSASLLMYENGVPVFESKIIVGKRSTPTPLLTSEITDVILYPYWMVPHSIAVKELLPSIKRNVAFLDANGYQVINSAGRVVEPYKINWSALNASNFPYTIRQTTGCDNALGLIKLNFYNPYSVYLHDTPNKSLFNLNKRYFSHGCMRVEKAMELGRIILKNNTIAIDTLSEKGCLYHQSPVIVPADESIPVFVLYNTAWIDSSGVVSFSEDIYRRNQLLFGKLP